MPSRSGWRHGRVDQVGCSVELAACQLDLSQGATDMREIVEVVENQAQCGC
jgi:hypothetical protein